jgi:hypothetical protein
MREAALANQRRADGYYLPPTKRRAVGLAGYPCIFCWLAEPNRPASRYGPSFAIVDL